MKYIPSHVFPAGICDNDLSAKAHTKLVETARQKSEAFVRRLIQTSIPEAEKENDLDNRGPEFMQSINGINVYEESQQDLNNVGTTPPVVQLSRLRSTCEIRTSMDEFIKEFAICNEQTERDSIISGIIDSQVLHVLPTSITCLRSGDGTEFAAINWFCLENSTLMTYDFVVLQYQANFVHRGRRGWVQFLQSIDLPAFPSVFQAYGMKRSHLYESGIVVIESVTNPDALDVTYTFGIHHKNQTHLDVKFLESSTWQRILKLAGLKKRLERKFQQQHGNDDIRSKSMVTKPTTSTQQQSEEDPSSENCRDKPLRASAPVTNAECAQVEPIHQMMSQKTPRRYHRLVRKHVNPIKVLRESIATGNSGNKLTNPLLMTSAKTENENDPQSIQDETWTAQPEHEKSCQESEYPFAPSTTSRESYSEGIWV